MANGVIRKADFRDEADMIAMLLCCLLFKLGGQVTMTLGEIHKIFQEYPEVRLILKKKDTTGMVLKPEHEIMTLQLRSLDSIQQDIDKGIY